MADGSVTIAVNADAKEAQKELEKVHRHIETIEARIQKLNTMRAPLVEQTQTLVAELDRAKAKLYEMQNAGAGGFTSAQIAAQTEQVRGLQAEYNRIQSRVEAYDRQLQNANYDLDEAKTKAGALTEEITNTSTASEKMASAAEKVSRSMERFSSRIGSLFRRAFVFSVISKGLSELKTWLGKVIVQNDAARASIARLKGALLTLAQPILQVVIPAFVFLVNVLTKVVSMITKLLGIFTGGSVAAWKSAAVGFSEEEEAITGVGEAAEEAKKSLAGFDEINQLTSDNAKDESASGGGSGGADGISPDFSDTNSNWLQNMLKSTTKWVTAALMLGGMALIAIGAATGSLPLVLAGLLLLGAGIYIGTETGVLQDWAEALGLNKVEEFISLALILGGIAIVAIGAALKNIKMVLAGLLLIGAGVIVADRNGLMEDWKDSLGLDRAPQYITGALMIAGFALICIGAGTSNILMVVAGAALLGTGIYIGTESGTIKSWAEALELDSVFGYVVAAMQLAGIALIAIGAMRASVALVIAGGVLLGLGIAAEAIGEETLSSWWETLKLTNVQQWVSAALLLAGIAFVAIGAATANILMVIAGALMLGISAAAGAENGNMKDWVKTLGLEKVAGWVTAGLLLVGLALVVFGILTANILMVLAGAALLGAGISVGVTSGTFSSWLDTIVSAFNKFVGKIKDKLDELWENVTGVWENIKEWFATKVKPKFTLEYWKEIFNGIAEGLKARIKDAINAAIDLMNRFIGWLNEKLNFSWKGLTIAGHEIFPGGSIQLFTIPEIPRLATGAVIPPNREFMAVLGDQTSGNNIEAPEALIRKIVREESGGSGRLETLLQTLIDITREGKTMELDGVAFAKVTNRALNNKSRAYGVPVRG